MVLSIEERQLRRACLGNGFLNTIDTYEQQSDGPDTISNNFDASSREDRMVSAFHKLKHLLENEMTQWWDIILLQKYLDVKRIPRGLRITNICNFLDDDPSVEWISGMSKFNRSWLKRIIKQRERNIVNIKT